MSRMIFAHTQNRSLPQTKLSTMASSSLLTHKRVTFANLKYAAASTRRPFCRGGSSPEEIIHHVNTCIAPATLTLDTSFTSISPAALALETSRRRCAGVLVGPKLIVTSAHAVGHVSTFHRFEDGSIRHKAYIGTTVASTREGRVLETMPLAVNFANDVAVLTVVTDSEDNFFYLRLGNSPDPGEEMVAPCRFLATLGNFARVREKTFGAQAPWPLSHELGWVEYDWFMSNVGNGVPPPETISFNCLEKPTGTISKFSGSPWFNLRGEIIGISSWEVRDDRPYFFVGFAVPPLSIRSVVDYANTKLPEDPIIMDEWIDAHVIP